MDWKQLTEDPRSLVDARLQLHHAAQLVSGVGRSYGEKKPDDSHTALTWSQSEGALVGRTFEGCAALLALAPAELRATGRNAESKGFALASSTLAEAEQWLVGELSARTGRDLGSSLAPLHYEIPSHAVGEGASFRFQGDSLAELGRWFANAYELLSEVRRRRPHATEILCWPHHFDIALLIELDRGRDVDRPRTIGVGMSPGDDYADEPYLYIGPYPRPADAALPRLTNGRWRTDGAFNIILKGSEAAAESSAAAQAALASSFLDEAIAAAEQVLERD